MLIVDSRVRHIRLRIYRKSGSADKKHSVPAVFLHPQYIFVRIYRHRHIRQSALPDKNAGNTGLFVYYIYTAITDIYIWMLNKLVCRSFSAKQYANDI